MIKSSLLFLSTLFTLLACSQSQTKLNQPTSNTMKTSLSDSLEQTTFGGGCFWCTEAVFLEVAGVEKVVSGYSGGQTKNPTYKEICTGTTGHAEVIQVTYNPSVISYEDLLTIFFLTHDPTTLNRQGYDKGTQYRSVIFYKNEKEKNTATQLIKDLEAEGIFDDPIVTEVSPLDIFYPAEDYHQNYYNDNPNQGYCRAVITPKMQKFRKMFFDKLKTKEN